MCRGTGTEYFFFLCEYLGIIICRGTFTDFESVCCESVGRAI